MTPVRHLTKRSLAFLANGSAGDLPEVVVACGSDPDDDSSLVMLYQAEAHGLTEATRPTCPKCAVLLDAALEGTP